MKTGIAAAATDGASAREYVLNSGKHLIRPLGFVAKVLGFLLLCFAAPLYGAIVAWTTSYCGILSATCSLIAQIGLYVVFGAWLLKALYRKGAGWTACVFLVAVGISAGILAGCRGPAEHGERDGNRAATSTVANPPPPAASVVTVEGVEGRRELGYVEPGSEHTAFFSIVNRSERPLSIAGVRSDCDCIQSRRTLPKSLAPGTSALAEVRFVAPKASQRYSHRLMVMADDPNRRVISLRVEADVGVPLEVRPRQVDAGTVAAGGQKRVPVEIVNRGKTPVHPLYATSSQGECIAEIPRAEIAPGKSLSIPVVVRAAEGAAGARSAAVLIHTDSPQQPSLEVQVRYEVQRQRG